MAYGRGTKHPGLLSLSMPSAQAGMSTWRKLGSKQAYRVTHQPVPVVSQCSLIAWLNGRTSGDLRRLTGSGSALEACSRRCAIQMAAYTLLSMSTNYDTVTLLFTKYRCLLELAV